MQKKYKIVWLKNFLSNGKGKTNLLEVVWGVFLYSIVNGMGFDVSHSITYTGTSFLLQKECVVTAQKLNERKLSDKQIGLDRGVMLRYVCLVIPQNGKLI